jgi:hypothetical protein
MQRCQVGVAVPSVSCAAGSGQEQRTCTQLLPSVGSPAQINAHSYNDTSSIHPPAEASRSSSAFGGAQFWAALRGVDKLEGEVRGLLAEANTNIRRRGGQPLLVESDLKLARFLAGLHVSEEQCEAIAALCEYVRLVANGWQWQRCAACPVCLICVVGGLMAVGALRVSLRPSAAAHCCRPLCCRAGWRGGRCRTLSAGCCWLRRCCRWQRIGC